MWRPAWLRSCSVGSTRNARRFVRPLRWSTALERLEDRTLLSALTVNSLADNSIAGDGLVTLREAVFAANSDTTTDLGQTGDDADVITFDAALAGGTITLSGSQLNLTQDVTVAGLGASRLSLSGGNSVKIFSVAGGVTATLSGMVLTFGRAVAGGAITNSGTLTVADVLFAGNHSQDDGGAVYNNGIFTAVRTNFSYNAVTRFGGAIYNLGTADIVGCTFFTNSVNPPNHSEGRGGAIYNVGTTVVTGTTFKSNDGSDYGGAVYTLGNLTSSDNSFFENIAGSGGALYARNAGRIFLSGCFLNANQAYQGGAVAVEYGSATGLIAVNSTFSGNRADNDGGAILNNGGDAVLRNVTVIANRANQVGTNIGRGGGLGKFYTNAGGTTTLYNSIVAGNFRGKGTVASDIEGPPLTAVSANNLIGDAGTSGGLSDGVNGNIVGNAGFGTLNLASVLDTTLRDNGGPTLTYALIAGSRALGAGSNAQALDADGQPLTTDQRGAPFARRSGPGVDIGAYEYQPLTRPLVVDTTADGSDGDYSAGQLSLREAVGLANGGIGADVITFAPSLAGRTIVLTGGELELRDDVTITGLGASQLTISGNNASRIFYVGRGTTASLSSLTLTGGTTSESGGAIYNVGNLSIAGSALSGNHADSVGGAVFNVGVGALAVSGSALSDNSAGYGGAIENFGTLTAVDSTFSGNRANENGGAIENRFKTAMLRNVTITRNRSDDDGDNSGTGGGLYTTNDPQVSTTVHNTIVAGNFRGLDNGLGTAGAPNDAAGKLFVAASVNNLIGDAATAGGLFNGENGNIVGVAASAVLDPVLRDNGGVTPTHALVAGSRAIGAGSNAQALDADGQPLTTDQRGNGFARIYGGTVDIGAFEVQPLTRSLVVDTTADGIDGDYSAGRLTLREAVGLSNGGLGADAITFAPSLAGGTIVFTGGALTLADAVTIAGPVTISGNHASGIFTVNAGKTVGLSGLTLIDGSASEGGAVNNAGTLSIADSTLRGNAANFGGAITNNGTLSISGSTLSGNTATQGGAVYNERNLTAVNSTFSGNAATFRGGAIHHGGLIANGSKTLVLRNVTITGNRADSNNSGNANANGGGLSTSNLAGVSSTLYNTIVAGNFRGTGVVADDIANKAVETASANNLIGDAGSAGGLTDGVKGNIVGALVADVLNPTLKSNGGPTFTHALVAGSRAINAGSNAQALDPAGNPLATDQRGVGFDRVSGPAVDIGSFESQVPVHLTVNNASVTEGNAPTGRNAVFTVRLTAAASITVRVNYQTTNGSATAGTDYTAVSGTLTFAPGQTVQTVQVPVTGDTTVERDETLYLDLSNPVAAGRAAILDRSRGVGVIVNDDTAALFISNGTVTEGNGGTRLLNLTVRLARPSDAAVRVDYTTGDLTAQTADGDYIAHSSRLVFAPGQTVRTVQVVVRGDTTVEVNETLRVMLSGLDASGRDVRQGRANGIGAILNDDAARVNIGDARVTEGPAGATRFLVFNLSLTSPVDTAIAVQFLTEDGTALRGQDYVAQSGKVVFAKGVTTQTIRIAIVGDAVAEADEMMFVNLTNIGASGRNVTMARSRGVGTIQDDDPAGSQRLDSLFAAGLADALV